MPVAWLPAWNEEWLAALRPELADNEILSFLRVFEVHGEEPGLVELEARLAARLQALLKVSVPDARRLLDRLKSLLSVWATSVRGREAAVDRERVLQDLSISAGR